MLYRIVLASAKHQHESAIHIHTSRLLLNPYPNSLLNLFNSSNYLYARLDTDYICA